MRVEVDPKKELSGALKSASRSLTNLTVPLKGIAREWYKSNRAIFSLKGPGKYQDLSTKPFYAWWESGDLRRLYTGGYREYKQAKWGFAYPILKRTGRLADSITKPTHGDAINQIINKKALLLGTNTPYAIFHHSEQPRKKLPFRPVVLFGNEQVAPGALQGRIEIWKQIIIDYAMQVTEKKFNGPV